METLKWTLPRSKESQKSSIFKTFDKNKVCISSLNTRFLGLDVQVDRANTREISDS
jgi:hypothetical protein